MNNEKDEIKVPSFLAANRKSNQEPVVKEIKEYEEEEEEIQENIPEETINQEEEKEVTIPNKNKKSKKSKKAHQDKKRSKKLLPMLTGSLICATAMNIGGRLATDAYKNFKDCQKADQLISAYSSEEVCVFPQKLYTDNTYDFKYCDGANLAQELERNNIDALVVGNNVYTKNGTDIAKIRAIVETKDYESFETYNADNGAFNVIPQGYTFDGNNIVKTDRFEQVIYLSANANANYEGITTANGYLIDQVLSVETIPTIKYEKLTDQDLIVDVYADVATATNDNEGTLKLVRKSSK